MRPDGKWVGVGEGALARLPVFHSSKPAAEGRVGRGKIGILHTAVFFVPESGIVPAQPELDCQGVRDLPAILQIYSIRMHAQPSTCLGRGYLKTAGQA